MRHLALLCLLLAGPGCDQVFGLEARDAGPGTDDGSPRGIIELAEHRSATWSGVAQGSLAFTDPVQAGDLIIVAVGTYPNDVGSISDKLGTTYEQPSNPVVSPGGSYLHVFYGTLTAAADPLTVTADAPAGSEISLAIHRYRGAAAKPFDRGASKAVTVATTSPGAGTLTTAVAGELVFAAISHDRQVVTSAGPDMQLAELVTDSTASTVALATEDRVVSPAQPVDARFSLSSDDTAAVYVLAFKPAPAL